MRFRAACHALLDLSNSLAAGRAMTKLTRSDSPFCNQGCAVGVSGSTEATSSTPRSPKSAKCLPTFSFRLVYDLHHQYVCRQGKTERRKSRHEGETDHPSSGEKLPFSSSLSS